jgi:formamidopyrimidine-DNA glycosylase
LVGVTLKDIIVDEKAKFKNLNLVTFPTHIVSITSYGKKILIQLDNDITLISSLGMTGNYSYYSNKHTHVQFVCEEITFYYNDIRRFGNIEAVNTADVNQWLSKLGPCLGTSLITNNDWIDIFTQPKLQNKQVCQVLMDQSLIAGIGNYLCADILYYSHIHPLRLVGSITIEQWYLIKINTFMVIELSFMCGGNTIKNFISPNSNIGTYQSAVYARDYDIYGYAVLKDKSKDNRTVYWVEKLQI